MELKVKLLDLNYNIENILKLKKKIKNTQVVGTDLELK